MNGKFSVVTPNFNMACFLPETIESVLVNLQPGDEYFVIDGGSTDGSVDVIRQYESHLTGWISESDNGLGDAVAKGFRVCKGDFMCWINSGDLLLKGALQAAGQALTETRADLIFGDDIYIDEQSKVLQHSRGGVRSLKNMMLYAGWTPLQDACFWRHSLYDHIGGINPVYKFALDYDFFLRASVVGKCVYVPKIFSAFRRHHAQISIRRTNEYEMLRQKSRQHVLDELGIPIPQRLIAEVYYRLQVIWRHHVTRRFRRPGVLRDLDATQLIVQ